ncbi:MgtC/SapB family protein [Zavarzinia sp. CC-PAN008]|uniref:MgtC/SapB family protein n=1 Tax=Zavarzinia sp. CC-PAN008 TaxID=3243332 RepID=UPI003F749341
MPPVELGTSELAGPQLALAMRLAVALAIGLLVGLERGWQARADQDGDRAAGLRTFALSGLLGGVLGALVPAAGALPLAAGFLAFAAVFTAFHWLEARAEKDFSATGVVAGLLTFALGALAVLGDTRIAIGATVAMVLLLGLKRPLHAWLRRLSWEEVRAVLILLAMTFLLLPVLPNRPIDPWQAINPSEIWLLAIIIAGLSFVGYVAVRVIGQQAGIPLVALAGGLSSSTAVTVTLSRLSREAPAGSGVLAGGVLLAGAVMVGRVYLLAGALNAALFGALLWPVVATGAVLLLAALVLIARASGRDGPALNLTNPLNLGMALKLALFIAAIMLLSRIVTELFGDAGLYALVLLSGIADADTLTLSLARQGTLPLATLATAIALGVASNSLAKAVMTCVLGTPALGLRVGVASLAAVAAGGGALWLG